MAIKKSTDEKENEGVPFDEENDGAVSSEDMKVPSAGFTSEQMEVIEDLQRQIREANTRNAEVSAALREEGYEDPIEDYLEEPAVFFAFASWFALHGDKRYNREVLPPREEAIIFEKLYRYPKRTGGARGVEVISVSQAVIRSKQTAQWLRDHSLFGIKFFESIDKAQNVNVTLAEKMAEMNTVVSNMSDHQVIERAKRENIPVLTSDLRDLRKQLIRHLAEGALKNEKHVHEMKFKDIEMDENDRVVENRKLGDVDADLQTTSTYT